MGVRRFLPFAALLLCGAVALAAEEVVEPWPDGSPRLRYKVDDDGRRHGVYTEFFENRKVAVKARYRHGEYDGIYASFYENGKKCSRAIYRRGLRTGKYEEWDEHGRWTWTARYRDGLLDGKAKAWCNGEALATQVWAKGELVKMDGVHLPSRPREEVARQLAGILKDAEPTPAEAEAMDADADRAVALARLRAYRCLCGVPWEDVVLDDACNAYAQAASRICAAIERITHTPPNPGWPKAEYEYAAHGAAECNLHQQIRAAGSIDGYMDDSDPRNIDALGHRCWSLNPRMQVSGFGATRSDAGMWFTAMWATDDTRAKVPELDAVCYPPVGWMPVDLFGPRYAWSVQFPRRDYPQVDPARVRVAIHRLDERFLRIDGPLPLDFQKVNLDARGYPICVIFRPAPFALEAGANHIVTISGLDSHPKKDVAFRYVVRWFDRRATPPTRAR